MDLITIICGIVTVISICVSVYYGRKSRNTDRIFQGAQSKIEEYQRAIEQYHAQLEVNQAQQNQIRSDELQEDRRQHRMTIAPRLWTNGGQINGLERKFSMNLNNAGEYASVTNIEVVCNNTRLITNRFPVNLSKGDSVYFWFEYIGARDMSSDPIEFILRYKDQEENQYTVRITGLAGRYREDPAQYVV